MKPMDYVVTGAGRERTFTPRTDRAKERTPEPVIFKDLASSLDFMKAVEADGFRVSGAELVDSTRKLVRYGYFVSGPGGQLIPRGHDMGPRDTVFEPGDSLGVKDGWEAIVRQVVTGKVAELAGCGVMILVEERKV
jgi:hypothetical protein